MGTFVARSVCGRARGLLALFTRRSTGPAAERAWLRETEQECGVCVIVKFERSAVVQQFVVATDALEGFAKRGTRAGSVLEHAEITRAEHERRTDSNGGISGDRSSGLPRFDDSVGRDAAWVIAGETLPLQEAIDVDPRRGKRADHRSDEVGRGASDCRHSRTVPGERSRNKGPAGVAHQATQHLVPRNWALTMSPMG